ncbi:chemotaxis protein CheW [Geitlerinema sp. P-1104]|uniref:chemotaxis protein CheW n=1 Tax=Geitlerinema sp. P-1104 TaxID=2546230 RepID=UPI001476FB4B|nr:chemotaxis protein CheW [Geitlerinema sp. P-1104]NMG58188.1 chemotaxis protein CheW [Geitlerinema sp. P-1104]
MVLLQAVLNPRLRRFNLKKRQQIRKQKLVILHLHQDKYAISIQQVIRVLSTLEIHGTFNYGHGLIQHQGETLAVLDLGVLLFQQEPELTPNYLIICQSHAGEEFAIPTHRLPQVLDVAEEQFAEVPPSYRQGPLGLALEKVVNLPEDQVLLYLNLDQLLAQAVAPSDPDSEEADGGEG